MLRAPLTRLIDRMKKVGLSGATFEKPQQTADAAPQPALSFDDLMKHPVSASAINVEKLISADLQKLAVDEKKQVTLLTRLISLQRVELDCTYISNLIFGSQLALLVRLSGTGNGMERRHAEEIFAAARATYPKMHADRSFEVWLEFLIHRNLISVAADRVDITQFGKDFLKYLVDQRAAYERIG